MSKLMDSIYEQFCAMLDEMAKKPSEITDDEQKKLDKLYSLLCKSLGISEHSQWRVHFQLEKWADTARKLAGFAPDEVLEPVQNVILDGGANELLKIIAGVGGTPYSASNAYIYVGTDNTPENASQSRLLASGANLAYAGMDTGYPVVNNRQIVYRASFGDTSANFTWNEAAIYNGTGANAVAMNRKVTPMGTKTTGTWTLQITISVTSA